MPIRSKTKPMQCANLSFPFARNFIGILSENQYPCVSYAKRLCQPDQPAEPCSIYLLEKLSWSSPPVESVRAGAGFFPEPNRKMDNFIHFSEHPTPVSLLVPMVSPFCHTCVVFARKASILQRPMESYTKTQQRFGATRMQMETTPTRAKCTWDSRFGEHQWASIGTTPFAVSLPAGSARSWLTSAL